MRQAIAGGREGFGLVDRADLGLVDDVALEHAEHHFVGDRRRVVILVGDAEHRVVVLAGEHRLVVALRDQDGIRTSSSADGALNPEFEVGAVKASFLPLMSAGVLIALSAGTMISIS